MEEMHKALALPLGVTIVILAFFVLLGGIIIPALAPKTEFTSTIVHKKISQGIILVPGAQGTMIPVSYIHYQFTMANGDLVNVSKEVYDSYNIGDTYTYTKVT